MTPAEPLLIANEFAEIRVRRIDTRNGARLLIESPKTGQWVSLCPLELEALTWQTTATFSAMVGRPYGPLISEQEIPEPTRSRPGHPTEHEGSVSTTRS
jgi:hypothetical protein